MSNRSKLVAYVMAFAVAAGGAYAVDVQAQDDTPQKGEIWGFGTGGDTCTGDCSKDPRSICCETGN